MLTLFFYPGYIYNNKIIGDGLQNIDSKCAEVVYADLYMELIK